MIEQQLIARRYQLVGPIGEGGMGAVHRANDRLKNEMVALKRILHTRPASSTLAAGGFPLMGRHQSLQSDQTQQERLALANEFKVLASLPHPNIVRVQDYGFHEHQPFFTMSLLQGAHSFLDACDEKSDVYKIELLIQFVQALTYLHRDLKIYWRSKRAN